MANVSKTDGPGEEKGGRCVRSFRVCADANATKNESRTDKKRTCFHLSRRLGSFFVYVLIQSDILTS